MAKTKKSKGKIVGRIFLVLGILLSMTAGSGLAYVKHESDQLLSMINYDNSGTVSDVDLSQYELTSDTDIINVLLVGADKNSDEQNENVERRSDSMMIATLDLKHDKLKVTSLMRDMYVEIPGYGGNKLNAAYAYGGIQLLYQTLAQNFGIKLDGYMEVNFDAFINVIDELGGIEVNLTKSEAYNLRNTNYIKRKKYRNVKKGKQTFNGQQALGYCRIRHGKRRADGSYPGVYTASGKGDDYGRTERQRLTVQAILKKVKQKSASELLELAEVILPNIKTDLSKDDIYSYLVTVFRMGTTKVNQYSIPIEGGYTSQKINGQACLVPDLESNRSALNKFIFKS
jgi:LCP family protein required for cell wall assembly